MLSPPGLGRIVWATGPDPQGGNVKRRPWVVMSDPTADGTVLIVAVTTQVGAARSSVTVELPSDPAGRPVTKLKKPCEVVRTWSMHLPPADLTDAGGAVPPSVLLDIQAKVERYT